MTITPSRRAFIGILALALADCGAKAPPDGAAKGKRILFVCQAGAVKSAIARELAKDMAKQRGLSLSIASRGIAPEDHLTPELLARLAAERIDPHAEPVLKLTQADLDAADTVVLFNRLPPDLRADNGVDWTDTPSVLEHYPEALASIRARVGTLLDRVQ